jgi:quinoprotein glucose dehydrogenase
MLHFGKLLGAFAAAGLALVCLNAQQKVSGSSRSLAVTNTTTIGSWSTYGGDKAFQRYSPLDQINRENVNNLQFVWHRPAVDPLLTVKFPDIKAPNYFRGTPILIDGLLYAPDGVGLVEAFDAATGQTRWVQQPVEPTLKEAAGQSTRGVAYWTNGSDKRIVSVRGEYLYAMSAKTGQPCRDFGENGRLSLNRHTKDDAPYFGWPGPFIVNDVIIVGGNGGGKAGSGYGDDGYDPRAQPEDIRGFDIHSGKLLWTFHVLPRKDEPGYDTWGKGSAEYMGNMAAWASLTADEKLGYVYIPLSAPTASHYGGQRPGKNLYSDSLLCLNAKTGKLVWFYQLVHHDLWEYDSATPPILGDINVDGKKIQAVIAADKTGFLYVFNRITGEPVWPIEERPVPKSTVPGEEPWPTQPFPTKPPPFDRQGFSEADLIDYTPELHQKALEIVSHFIMGPLFTPPSIRDTSPGGKLGTLVLPGGWGAGNWNTGAFDPETGMYYAVSMTQAGSFGLTRNPDPENPMLYGTGRLPGAPRPSPEHRVEGPTLNIDGLPIYKGPYGRITAIDLNKGTIAWMVPNGDGPRYHPLIKDLHLGPLGTAGRPVPLVTKTLLFLSESSDATMGRAGVAGPAHFRAYDKATGAVIWEKQIPVGTTGGPITYVSQGKQYIVLPVGGNDYGAGWLALAMASPADAVDVTRAPIKAPTIAAEATPAIFTLGQADRGKKIFETKCSTCHGVSTWGPSLEGESFWKNWNQKSARSLYSSIIGGMPPDRPGSLSEQTVLDIVAYLFHTNNLPSGDKEIVSASELNTVPVTRPK